MKKKFTKGLVAGIVLLLIIAVSFSSYTYFKGKNKTSLDNDMNKTGINSISENNNDNTITNNENNSTNNSEINGLDSSKDNKENVDNKNNINGNKDNNDNDSDKSNGNTLYSPKIKKPDAVKAVYLTGWSAGETEKLNSLISLTKQTEVNSFVVDIKDDDGLVGYATDIPAVKEIKGFTWKYNVDKVITTLHDNDIYVIGRLVCFKDPVLSTQRVDLAVKNTSGGLWKDNFNKTWLDPYNKDSWTYLIDIAKEALSKGFDEIQFDYVRFPNDGNKKAMIFNASDKKKYELINEFLTYAKSELPGGIISADVFGIICESPEDTEDIGQYLELIGKDIDCISPMVYPSHYAFGQMVNNIKFLKPDLEPYGVVYNSLLKTKNRLALVDNYKAGVRPYLQGFTASYLRSGNYQTYGAKQIKEQIKAVYDAGYTEWIIWDPNNKYPIEAFEMVD